MNWINTIAKLSTDNVGFVLVTVIATEGSTPRDTEAKMVITTTDTHDSIGGGNLEHDATRIARELLQRNKPAVESRAFTLGKDLTQCCGGNVTLLFECFPACEFNIVLFGAGHVGKALATILAQLPCRVTWIDPRENIFPEATAQNIQTRVLKNPFEAVESCPKDAYYLIMTHSHELDMELCEAILTRHDTPYCGLIGSKSKAAKFRSRLGKKGFTPEELALLTCPIGLESVRGKTPMEVAVSISGQLLGLRGVE